MEPNCVFCNKILNEQADIVYCPDCGAPAHRSCWQAEGECAYADRHGGGFHWHSPEEIARDKAREDHERAERDFCERKYMGVSEREMLYFLNANSPHGIYRMALMKYMAEGNRKVSFNAFAGILSPYNQFYRGMSALGLLLTVLNFITALPQILLYYAYYVWENTELLLDSSFVLAANLMSWLQLTVMALLCVFGDYLYLRYMVKSIKKVRLNFYDHNSEEYAMALAEAGRPRWSRVLIGFGIQMVLVLGMVNLLSITWGQI